MSETDDMDFYIEKIDKNNPNLVMYKNEWVQLKSHKEIIKVKGERRVTSIRTLPGPLLNDTKYAINSYISC